AVLRMVPRPKGREIGWVGVPTPEAALALFSLALERAGAGLTAFELIGAAPVDMALAFVPGSVAPLAGRWPWHVLVEISSGRSAADASNLLEEILASGIEAGAAGDAVIASSLAQAGAFWKLREAV